MSLELIAENRFNSKDPNVRNTMLSLASLFGTKNVMNALELLDSSTSNSYKHQRWKRHGDDTGFPDCDTVVIEFVASSSQRSLFQVTCTV